MKATKTINVTVTMTLDELKEFRAAMHDASSYWYKNLVNAENEAKDGKDPALSINGARLVYQERVKMYDQLTQVYEQITAEE